jgi:hypothetical protein
MLAFLIPVKHPARASSYTLVTDLLRLTLASLARQTLPAFSTYVVCNEVPSWAGSLQRAQFIKVDFPPARPPDQADEQHSWVFRDKGSKTAVALDRAQRDGATHVMTVDADDFVSRRLAEHVTAEPTVPGWFFPTGLIYSRLFRIAEMQSQFWSHCGTSHIVRTEFMPAPPSFGAAPALGEVSEAYDPWFLDNVLGNHGDWQRHFTALGHPLRPLPFPGAVWQVDTGENSCRAWWHQRRFGPLWGKPLTPDQADEFGIPIDRRSAGTSALLQAWRLVSLARKVSGRARAGG